MAISMRDLHSGHPGFLALTLSSFLMRFSRGYLIIISFSNEPDSIVKSVCI